jgi:uncharacterized protein YjbJ (UPF0337 family)
MKPELNREYLWRNQPYLTDMLRMTDYTDSSRVPHNRSFNFILFNQLAVLTVPPKLLWRTSCFMHSCQNERTINLQKENTMKTSTKDQVQGTFHEIKGKVKETAGKLSDNPDLEGKGLGEKIAGKVQKKVGQVEKVLEK